MTLREWLDADKERTQEKLAADAGVSQPTISRILLGGDTTKRTARAICAATGWEVSLGDILLNDEPA